MSITDEVETTAEHLTSDTQGAAGCRRLTGRAAIVTGGASGIGAATARRLVSEGARVTIGDLNGAAAEALAKELGDQAQGIEFDAGDVSSVQDLVEAAVSWAGRLDILHNNAAIMAPEHIARDTTPADIDFDVWDKTFQVNVRGYLAGIKYAVPHMIQTGGGSIVLTASGSALLGDLSNIAYGSSKGAIAHTHQVRRDDLRPARHPLQRHQPGSHPHRGRQAQRHRSTGRHHGTQHPRASTRTTGGHRRLRGLSRF